jgi:hypothetical protein
LQVPRVEKQGGAFKRYGSTASSLYSPAGIAAGRAAGLIGSVVAGLVTLVVAVQEVDFETLFSL